MCFLLLTNELNQLYKVYFAIKERTETCLSKITISSTLGFSKLPLTALFKST